MNKYTPEQMAVAFDKMGYKFYKGAYNLNIYGIRNPNQTPNKFDDIVGVVYQDENDEWHNLQFKATTDPGLYWLQNPMREAGTIIMMPQQARGCYKIGTHKGYEALQQVKPMKYVRDNDKDNYLDFALMEDDANVIEEIAATNIHRANSKRASVQVDKWSAGCQVIASPVDFGMLMGLCNAAVDDWGFPNSFTYTLFTEQQVEMAI